MLEQEIVLASILLSYYAGMDREMATCFVEYTLAEFRKIDDRLYPGSDREASFTEICAYGTESVRKTKD